MNIPLKLTILYILLVLGFNFYDNKRRYNNLILLIMIIVLTINYLLNNIIMKDLIITIILIFIANKSFTFFKASNIKKVNKPVSLIINGDIDYEALRSINKNSFWLIYNMEKKRIKLEDIIYAFYINEKTYFIKKN